MHNLEGMAVFINITDEVNNRPYSTIPGRDSKIQRIEGGLENIGNIWFFYISLKMVFPHVQLRDKSVKNPGIFLPKQKLRPQSLMSLIHQWHQNQDQWTLMELLQQNCLLFLHLFVFYSIWFDFKCWINSAVTIGVLNAISPFGLNINCY